MIGDSRDRHTPDTLTLAQTHTHTNWISLTPTTISPPFVLFPPLSDRVSMVTHRGLSVGRRGWALRGPLDQVLNEHQVIGEGQAMLPHHRLQFILPHQVVKHLHRGLLMLQRTHTRVFIPYPQLHCMAV